MLWICTYFRCCSYKSFYQIKLFVWRTIGSKELFFQITKRILQNSQYCFIKTPSNLTDAKVGCILYKFVLLFIHVVYHGYYNEENTVRGVFSFIIALFIFGYVCIVYVLRILKKKTTFCVFMVLWIMMIEHHWDGGRVYVKKM